MDGDSDFKKKALDDLKNRREIIARMGGEGVCRRRKARAS
jgi:hypothetical protein